MCKIAVLDPDRVPIKGLIDEGLELYRSQRSGLGIVAVKRDDGKFTYEVGKWLEPRQQDIGPFIAQHHDDSDWFILHGRMATSGSYNSLDATHPIEVDCQECNIDYVLHNGVYSRKPTQSISYKEKKGHTFTTGVDSELMAHRMGKVPETIDEADGLISEAKMGFERGVILLNEDRILLYSDRKYQIDENGEMYTVSSPRKNGAAKKNYSMMIILAEDS